jgi:alkylated DNA repair dioxygenase AlkB
MYDREVDVPRLTGHFRLDETDVPPAIAQAAEQVVARSGVPFNSVGLNFYRDGRDSVAFHGDRLGPAKDDAIVAIVALGTRRRFLLRPAGGGRSRAFDFGGGDLLVMGGTCQRTWEHGIPKSAHAGLRISIQLRSAPVVAARY